jgi:hypothetical protein
MCQFIVRETGVGAGLKMTVGEQNMTGKDIHYYKSIRGIVTYSCCQKFPFFSKQAIIQFSYTDMIGMK